MSPRSLGRRSLVTVAVLALALLLVPSGGAHAGPLDAYPAPAQRVPEPPTRIWVEFNEPVDAAKLRLLTANRTEVPHGSTFQEPEGRYNIEVADSLVDGAYVVEFDALSLVDGHESRGAWTFVVGNASAIAQVEQPSTPFPWMATAGKVSAFAGLALIVGALATRLWLPRAPDPVATRRTLLVAMVGAGLYSLGTLLHLSDGLAAGGSTLGAFILLNSFGRALATRFVLGLVLVGMLLASGRGRREMPYVALALTTTLLILLHGWTSHAAARTDIRLLGALLDAVHLAAVLAWTGGVFNFLMTISRWPGSPGPLAAHQAAASARFSRLSMASVAVLTMTGLALVWLIIGTPTTWTTRLLGTGYGFVLAYKVLLALLMMGFGGVNHVFFIRRYAAATPAPARPLFVANVRREAINGLIVLVAAAGLTSLSPF